MKAVACFRSLPVDHPEALLDVELPEPVCGARDLLVEVKAVSVNPVDAWVRQLMPPAGSEATVLGYDAAGVVLATGPEVTLFRPGDEVFYAGAIGRPGTNSERHLVDERIVGRKPANLDFAQAAALPLTALTAWELLFDRLGVGQDKSRQGEALLVIGAAGGVGSMLVQLARQLTGLTVIATAGRPDSVAWLERLGAHHVIDHHKPLADALHRVGVSQVNYVASLTHTDDYFSQIVDVLAPQGRFGLIDEPESLDVRLLKRKAISLHWEMMFTRSLFRTPDMVRQHEVLNTVADMVEAGTLVTTVSAHVGRINAENLRKAHALMESGQARGKVVLEGFGSR